MKTEVAWKNNDHTCMQKNAFPFTPKNTAENGESGVLHGLVTSQYCTMYCSYYSIFPVTNRVFDYFLAKKKQQIHQLARIM